MQPEFCRLQVRQKNNSVLHLRHFVETLKRLIYSWTQVLISMLRAKTFTLMQQPSIMLFIPVASMLLKHLWKPERHLISGTQLTEVPLWVGPFTENTLRSQHISGVRVPWNKASFSFIPS